MMPASARPICPKPSSTTSPCSARVTAPPPIFDELERLVDRALRRGRVVGRDDERDVQLRRALGDGDDVDAAPASAENTRAAMPGCRPCRGPTTATVAMPGLHLDAVDLAARDLVGERARQALARRACAACSGTVKQIDCSDDDWVMSETEIPRWCSAAKVRAAMPGTPSMPLPADGDQRLAGRRRQRLDRVLVQRAARRDLGARPRRDRRTAARTRGMRPARERDERPRVQHLGAVIGQLGRLAQVELRDDARVGHHARIGGEQPGHVLPQRHPRAPSARPSSVAVRSEPPRPSVATAGSSVPPLSSSMQARRGSRARPGPAAASSGRSRLRAARRSRRGRATRRRTARR